MTEVNYQELLEDLTPERLEAYREPGESIEVAIQRYLRNMCLADAMWSSLHLVEVLLRNRTNKVFSEIFGKDWLLERPEALDLTRKDHNKLDVAKNRFRRNQENIDTHHNSRELTNDDMVANLSFGFWNNLYRKKYHSIWYKKGVLEKVFPHLPKEQNITLDDISEILVDINLLRNRIAHHASIYNLPYKEIHAKIVMLIGAMSPVSLLLHKEIDRLPEVAKKIDQQFSLTKLQSLFN